MFWLGQPCTLHAVSPGALLQVASRSVAFRAAATSSLQATEARASGATAALGLLSGQVHFSPANEIQAPCKRHWRSSHRPRCPWRESLLPKTVCFVFPAAGAEPRPSKGKPLLVSMCPGMQPGGEAADARRLRSGITLQAVGSKVPAGGKNSSLGSGKESSGSAENDNSDLSPENGKKPNKSQQLKKVFKEYGAVGVAFHVGISLMSLGMFYLAVSSGMDMTAILFKLGFDEAVVQSKLAAGTSTFVLAYAIHKLFAPVRISITLVSVPLLVRYFRKIGFFKPPAPTP